MLLWEVLGAARERKPATQGADEGPSGPPRAIRLPYDKRCAAITKDGTRCRGKIHKDGEFCIFHDPELAAKRERNRAAANPRRRKLMHLPDGYLRRMSHISTVGEAMDRLYREVRLGQVTLEMGDVLFRILTRMMDEGLVATGPCPQRTKAARLRPKMKELLTRSERIAWRRAVDTVAAPPPSDRKVKQAAQSAPQVIEHPQPAVATAGGNLRLQAAS